MPLDTLQVKPINDKFRSFAKGARLAVDVLEFDSSVERAIHYSCGNALVCDTMDIAKHVVYDKGQEVKGWYSISSSITKIPITVQLSHSKELLFTKVG